MKPREREEVDSLQTNREPLRYLDAAYQKDKHGRLSSGWPDSLSLYLLSCITATQSLRIKVRYQKPEIERKQDEIENAVAAL